MCNFKLKDEKKMQLHIYQVHNLQRKEQCDKCEKYFEDEDELNEHVRNVHESRAWFREVKGRACRYFRQGRCRAGPSCTFRHELPRNSSYSEEDRQSERRRGDEYREPQPQPQGEVKHCRRGERCRFKAEGRCNFFHSDVGVQRVWREPQRSRETQEPREGGAQVLWCRYQDRCKDNQSGRCKFQHFEGFPLASTTKRGEAFTR